MATGLNGSIPFPGQENRKVVVRVPVRAARAARAARVAAVRVAARASRAARAVRTAVVRVAATGVAVATASGVRSLRPEVAVVYGQRRP